MVLPNIADKPPANADDPDDAGADDTPTVVRWWEILKVGVGGIAVAETKRGMNKTHLESTIPDYWLGFGSKEHNEIGSIRRRMYLIRIKTKDVVVVRTCCQMSLRQWVALPSRT